MIITLKSFKGFTYGTKVVIKLSMGQQTMEAFLHQKCSNHHHVLKILDIFCSPSFTAIVLPAWGQDLSSPTFSGRLQQKSVLNICWQIASGMTHIHELKILHGDLHTGNVLVVTDTGERPFAGSPRKRPCVVPGKNCYWVQITDFGAAVICDPVTYSSVIRYPVFYRPPELLLSMYMCQLEDESCAGPGDGTIECVDCKHLQVLETTWNYFTHTQNRKNVHNHISHILHHIVYGPRTKLLSVFCQGLVGVGG